MTAQERIDVMKLVGNIIVDNNGNRITRALAMGICTELDNLLPKAEEPTREEQ